MVCRFRTALPEADETSGPHSCVDTRRTDPWFVDVLEEASKVTTPDAGSE
jgi:hypothetical protein